MRVVNVRGVNEMHRVLYGVALLGGRRLEVLLLPPLEVRAPTGKNCILSAVLLPQIKVIIPSTDPL